MTATMAHPRARVAVPPPRINAPEAMTAIAIGAVAVIALWWRDTATVSGLGDWLTNAGRITGLLAGYAVVVLIALMARVPALERGVGTDRLTRWHAMGGRYTVSLAVAHTLLIIWGYAVTAHTSLVHQTGQLLLSYPDVMMATVALGLLVAVGVVSARAARKRLRYETWHFIHLYTYLAVALAFSHQFSTGADFIHNRPARVLWSALYLVVGAVLLWYRVVAPVLGYSRHDLRVARVQRESDDIVSVYIRGRNLHAMGAEPGQFFRWRFLTKDLWWAGNPYSLSAVPRGNELRITVKVVGEHSAALAHLKPGTRVLAEGPSGSFTAGRRTSRKVVLIAGGVGITPLRALFESLPGRPGEITLLYRIAHTRDIVLRDELEQIAAERGAVLHFLVGPPKRGANDHLSAYRLGQLVPDLSHSDVFLCGPEPMMVATESALREVGVPRRRIHQESFVF
jgi:predicted ferric reductase